MAILKNRVLKQVVEEAQEKIEILSISNTDKDMFENLIDSLDIES